MCQCISYLTIYLSVNTKLSFHLSKNPRERLLDSVIKYLNYLVCPFKDSFQFFPIQFALDAGSNQPEGADIGMEFGWGAGPFLFSKAP